jgi:hypothetical protein
MEMHENASCCGVCVFVFGGGPIIKNQPPKEKECEGFDLSPLPHKLIIVI